MVHAPEVGFILRVNHPLPYHTCEGSRLFQPLWGRKPTVGITWVHWKGERDHLVLPLFQAGSRRARYGMAANHHLTPVAESIGEDTGSLARDAKERGE